MKEDFSLSEADFDTLFNVPPDDLDVDTFSEPAELQQMPVTHIRDLLVRPNGTMKHISEISAFLCSQYESINLPFDPTCCHHSCINAEIAIANRLECLGSDLVVDFTENKEIQEEVNGRTVSYAIHFDAIPAENPSEEKLNVFGRTLAADKSYYLAVERHIEEGHTLGYQFILLQKTKDSDEFIDAAIIMDVMEGYKPYENVYMYGAFSNDIHGIHRYDEFRKVCDELVGFSFGGNLATPEPIM